MSAIGAAPDRRRSQRSAASALGAIGAPAAGPSDRAAWQPGVEPERRPHEHVAVAPTRRRERAGGGTTGLVAAEAPLERVDELGERRRSVGFGPVGQCATRTHQPGQLDSLGVHLRAEPLDLCRCDALLAFALQGSPPGRGLAGVLAVADEWLGYVVTFSNRE